MSPRVFTLLLVASAIVAGQALNACLCFNTLTAVPSGFVGSFNTVAGGSPVNATTCDGNSCPAGTLLTEYVTEPSPNYQATLTASTCGAVLGAAGGVTDCLSLCSYQINVYAGSSFSVGAYCFIAAGAKTSRTPH